MTISGQPQPGRYSVQSGLAGYRLPAVKAQCSASAAALRGKIRCACSADPELSTFSRCAGASGRWTGRVHGPRVTAVQLQARRNTIKPDQAAMRPGGSRRRRCVGPTRAEDFGLRACQGDRSAVRLVSSIARLRPKAPALVELARYFRPNPCRGGGL